MSKPTPVNKFEPPSEAFGKTLIKLLSTLQPLLAA
jgi:hypothetical protein